MLCGSISADDCQSPEQEEGLEAADEAGEPDNASGAISDPGASVVCRPPRKRTPRAKGGEKNEKKDKKSGRSLLFRKSISETTWSLRKLSAQTPMP